MADDFELIPVEARQEQDDFELVPVGSDQGSDMLPKSDKKFYQQEDIEKEIIESGDLDLAMRVSKGDLDWALGLTKGVNPEVSAKVKSLFDKTRLPKDTIQRNLPEITDRNAIKEIRELLLQKDASGKDFKYGKTLSWLLNPEKMAIAKDDVKALAKIEAKTLAKKPWYKLAGHSVKEGAKQLGQGLMSNLRANWENELKNIESREYLDPDLKATHIKNAKAMISMYSSAKDSELLASGAEPDLHGFGKFAYDAIGIGPQIAAVVGSSIIGGPAAGALFMGSHIKGTTYGELRSSGVSHERAEKAAYANATIQGALEYVQIGAALKLLKTSGGTQIAKQFISTMLTEFGAEALQSLPESATRIWAEAEKDGKSLKEQVNLFWAKLPETAKQGMYEGLVVLPFAAIGGSAKLVTDVMKQRDTQQNVEEMQELEEAIQETKLKDRSPETLEDFLKHTTGEESFFVPIEALNTLYQEDNSKVKDLLEDLDAEDQIEDAIATGKKIEISKAKYLAKYSGTDILNSIKDKITFDIEGLSLEEITEQQKETEKELDEIYKEQKAEKEASKAPEGLQKWQEDLVSKGMSKNNATQMINLFDSFLDRNKREGETKQEYFERRGFELGFDENGKPSFYQTDPLGFYSELQKQIDAMDFKQIPAKDLSKRIKKIQGLKAEELEWTGINEWLEAKEGKVSKEEVVNFLSQGGVQLEEVQKLEENAPDLTPVEGEGDLGEKTWTVEGNTSYEPQRIRETEDGYVYEYRSFNNGLWEELDQLNSLDEAIRTMNDAIRDEVEHNPESDFVSETKYGKWQLPGGENYREVLLRIGKKDFTDQYQSSHWNETNVLAHFRLNDRVDSQGRKTLFIEEIQSDWHQEGRKNGYKGENVYEIEKVDLALDENEPSDIRYLVNNKKSGKTLNRFTSEKAAKAKLKELQKGSSLVPDAPFKNSDAWAMLAFKRILRMAAEQGYDAVAWTPGEVQAERYDLSKQVENVAFFKQENGNYDIQAQPISGTTKTIEKNVAYEKLEDYIGKDLASKIDVEKQFQSFKGPDLKVGGEGMKGFYDKLLPKAVGKYIKKLDKSTKVSVDKIGEISIYNFKEVEPGVFEYGNQDDGNDGYKIEQTVDGFVTESNLEDLGTAETIGEAVKLVNDHLNDLHKSVGRKVWHLPLTDKIKEKVLEGQTLFQDKKKGSVTFADNKTIINLFKNADMSTFLHESGHVFLNEMKNIIDSGYADEQQTKDYSTLLEYADGKLDKDGHEKIARAFENYLMEGNAPSLKLKEAFRRFKRWLLKIYRYAANLDAPLNDEIRGVFDRMLASEEEINEFEKLRKSKESFLKNVNATKMQREKLENLYRKAKEEALEYHTERTMRAYLRTKGMKAAIEARAEKEINESPVHKAIEDAINSGGVDLGAVKAEYGDDTAKILKKHNGLLREDGKKSLTELAMEYDFNSEDEFIDELLKTETKKKAVESRINSIKAERENEIRKELSKEETLPGEESFYNEAHTNYLLEEAKVIAERAASKEGLSAKRYDSKVYSNVAEAKIANFELAEATSHYKYTKTEQGIARKIVEALEKGKSEEALILKEKQLMAHAMTRASLKAKEQREKIEKRFSNLKKTKKGNIIGHYHDAILHILNSYGLSDKGASRPDKFDLDAIIDEIENGVDPIVLPNAVKNLSKTDYTKMTFAEFQELATGINILASRGRNTIKWGEEDKEASVEDKAKEGVGPMRGRKRTVTLYKDNPFYGISERVKGVLAEAMHIQFDLKIADNYTNVGTKHEMGPNEKMFDAIFKSDIRATEALLRFNREHMDSIGRSLEAIHDRLQTGRRGKQIEGVVFPEILKRNNVRGWTSEMIVSFALNMGNTGNMETLLNGFGMSIDEGLKVVEQLTSDELNTIQKIWDAIDSLFSEMDETFYKQNGYRLARVEKQRLSLKGCDGSVVNLEGGYYPIKHDAELSRTVAGFNEKDLLQGEILATHHRNKPRDSFTKERKGSSYPIKLSIQPLYKHINDTIRYTHLAGVLTDVHKVVRNNAWADAYTHLLGKERYNSLTPWLSNIARPEAQVSGAAEAMMHEAQRLTAIGALGMNLMSMLKQPISITSTVSRIGLTNTSIGLAHFAKDPIRSVRNIEDLSPFMKSRGAKVEMEIARQLDRISPFKKAVRIGGKRLTVKDLQDFSLVNIRIGDILGAYPTWLAGYNKALKEGKTQKQAVHAGDYLVSETQPVMTAAFKNLWQMGGAKATGADKIWRWTVSPFTGWVMKYGSRVRTQWGAWREGKMSTKDFVQHFMLESIAPVTAVYLLKAAVREDEIDDWDLFAWEALGYWASHIPYLSSIPRMFQYGPYSGAMELPAANVLKKGTKAVKTFGATVNGDKKILDTAIALGEFAEFWYGVPALKAGKEIKRTAEAVDQAFK